MLEQLHLSLIVTTNDSDTPRQRLVKLNHDHLNSQGSKTLFCSSILNELPINYETKSKYDELAYEMEKAAHETIPKRNRPQPGWFKEDEHKLNSLIEKRNSASSLKISGSTRSSSQRLRKIRKLKSAINTAKNKWISDTCYTLNESASSRIGTKKCWDTARVLKNKLNKPERSTGRMMRKEDGTRRKSNEEKAQVFREHFKKLYERVPMYDGSVLELL